MKETAQHMSTRYKEVRLLAKLDRPELTTIAADIDGRTSFADQDPIVSSSMLDGHSRLL